MSWHKTDSATRPVKLPGASTQPVETTRDRFAVSADPGKLLQIELQ